MSRLSGVCSKSANGMAANPPLVFDTVLETNMKAYIKQSVGLLAEIDQRLRRSLAGISEIILWGGPGRPRPCF